MFPCQEIKFNIIQSLQFKTSEKFLPSLVILKVSALGLYQDFWVKVFILIPQIQFSICEFHLVCSCSPTQLVCGA